MRKGLYFLGMSLIAIGIVFFLTTFVSALRGMNNPMGPVGGIGNLGISSLVGIIMIGIGGVLMRVGARGVAGSGLLLDPKRARRDLEPWSRAAGGMVQDALDEAGVKPAARSEQDQLAFDEKLRRLEQLRKDGLITEEEYQHKREEFLSENW
jgi:hypothetical protein